MLISNIDDRTATDYANPFYEAHGPRRLIQVWDEQLRDDKRHKRWDESFVNNAVDVVADRNLRHLDDSDVKKNGSFRTPVSQRKRSPATCSTTLVASIATVINLR